MMFLPRNSILSWRSKECVNSNDDNYVRELEQNNDTEEQPGLSSEILSDSSSVQDLAFLFSKLSLRDTIGNVEINTQDERNSVNIGFKDERSKRKYFHNSWHFPNIQGPIVHTSKVQLKNNQSNVSNYFALHFKPLFSGKLPGSHGNVVVCKSTNIGTECVETVWGKRRYFHREDSGSCWVPTTETVRSPQSSHFVTNHQFIDSFGSFYRYRSRFSLFLANLLARAGRLKDNCNNFIREDVCIYEDSLNEGKESTAEMQQKNSEYRLLVRRIPSQKQANYLEEQTSRTEYSQTVFEEGNTSSAEYKFCVKEVTLIEGGLGAEIRKQETCIEEHETSNEARKSLKSVCRVQENEELNIAMEHERITPEEGFCPDEDETLVAEPDMYPCIREQERSTPEQGICLEEELTLVPDQENLTPEREIYADEELIFVENLGQETSTAEQGIYREQLTLVKEQDDSINDRDDDYPQDQWMCVRAIDDLLAEIETFLRVVPSGEYTCIERQVTCAEEQETYPGGQETNLGGQETNLEGQETYIEGQETYLEEQETNLEEQETNLEGQETYVEGQETYLEGQEKNLEEQETNLEEQETNLEGQETNLEGQETYLEGQETNLEEQETNLEGQETYLEGQETNLEGQETNLEGQETNLEGQETYLKGHETYFEDQDTNSEQEGIYLDEKETHFEGLGEETFRTVSNVSPRAKDLFQRARNLFRY